MDGKVAPILIIDASAIAHSVKFKLVHLTYDEQSVGVIFGFLRKVKSLAKTFQTNRFVFAWDSRRRKRSKLYPDYKKNRKEKTPEMYALDKLVYPQIDDLRHFVIPTFGFKNSFVQSGLEADDIIAVVTQNYEDETIIVSGDGDLFQLLNSTTHMCKTQDSGNKLYKQKDFEKEYGINPSEWATVKTIAGCTSDNVAGVERVGEKTAIKYLKGELKETTKAYQNIRTSSDIIERNDILVRLPFPSTRKVQLNWNETFKIANFLKITDKYGLRSFEFEKELESWINLFGMK